jgi:hypothetical protein
MGALHRLLCRLERPEVVEEQGGGNHEEEKRSRRPARLPTYDEQDASPQFDQYGQDRGDLRQRYALASDGAYRTLETGDFPQPERMNITASMKRPASGP